MLRLIRNIATTKNLLCTSSELTTNSSMGDLQAFIKKKRKYDGRSKKRRWEERRSDYPKEGTVSEEIADDKKPKLSEDIKDKIKRRKYVLMLGYSGVDYYGMQRNPRSRTIEEDLITALLKSELITQEAFDQIQNIQFQRAARTDKGVSAVRQIVSLKLPETFDIQDINKHLPPKIRVFGAKRVTKGFNSKSHCDARTYSYMLPTVAFSHYEQKTSQADYRLPEESLNKVNELLQNYVGTKNYHNFTSKKKPTDPSAKRFMKSFVCEPPIVRKDVEFAVMKVRGQSFMLHQIRKMVGLIISIMRGHTTEDVFKQVFTTESINLPRAPGLGLVLEYVHYDRYNNRYGSDGMHEKLTWDEVEEEVNNFKEEYIYPTIINGEINENSMVTWLDKLFRHGFDDMAEADEEGANDCDDGSDNEHENVVKSAEIGDEEEKETVVLEEKKATV